MAEVPPPLPARPQSFSLSNPIPHQSPSHSDVVATPPRLPPRKSYATDVQAAQPVSTSPTLASVAERNTNAVAADRQPVAHVQHDHQQTESSMDISQNDPQNDPKRDTDVDAWRTGEEEILSGRNTGKDPLSKGEALSQNPAFRTEERQPSNPFEPFSSSQDLTPAMNNLQTPRHLGTLPLPSLANIALISFLVVLAYAGASFVTLIIASAGVYYLWADWQRREAMRRRDPEADREKVKGKVPIHLAMAEESTEWLNHILKALFPVLTTDLLTPFIDLLEDVMLQQVPPLVSSIRVTEPSLGEEPIRIVSMRPMSDPEWFEHLSRAPSAPANKIDGMFSTLGLRKKEAISRSSSSASVATGHTRKNSQHDRDQRAYEAEERIRRDRILRDVGGRRGQGMGAFAARSEKTGQTALKPEGDSARLQAGDALSEGTAVRGDENDAVDGDVGQYINLAIDFSYDGRKNRKGWDLHFLIFMGIGIKGLAGFEVPTWVTMLKITGTVHIRLLLSPDVPFVRTATISLPTIPEFDFAAKPIKDYAPDVVGLPLVKPYIAKSIREVCDNFVRPNSYTLDVDRLLLGQEAALRTEAIGVLHVRIHSARDLKQSDTIGSSDPYCVISFAKYGKPIWSSRTIVDTLNPRWEEDAFILISAEAIESGERLRLIVYDGDRWSADDPLGMVSEDLAGLLGMVGDQQPEKRNWVERDDELKPRRKGYTAKGNITWSYAFYPIWKMPQDGEQEDELAQDAWRKERHGSEDRGTGRDGQVKEPGLLYKFLGRFKPEPFEWENERKKRRLESIAWLTGERARETMEATQKPTLQRRSGVLLFQIHQAIDLELEKTGGTLTSAIKKRPGSGAAGGPPALAESLEAGPWEADKLPSAYAEVILNGKLIFRTRTKQLSPQPYWNARAERFIRDFSVARMVIVVRNEKNREHDPILGIVAFDLASMFHHTSQVTRTMPIVGGLGHGNLRISLLFKPIDAKLPPSTSGYELATVKIKSLKVSHSTSWLVIRPAMEVVSDVDELVLHHHYEGSTEAARQESVIPGPIPRSTSGQSNVPETSVNLDFGMRHRRRRILAVQYRHSCSIVLRFVDRKGKLKKNLTVGIALFRLADIADNSEVELTLPIYRTDDMNEAAELEYQRMNSIRSGQSDPQGHLSTVTIRLAVYTGISKVHRKLATKDERLRRVYEAWELAKDLGDEQEFAAARQRGRIVNQMVNGQRPEGGNHEDIPGAELGFSDDIGDESDTESDNADCHSIPSDDSGLSDVSGNDKPIRRASSASARAGDNASTKSAHSRYRRWREESKALHKENRGIMQNGVMRSIKYSKEKVQTTFSSGRSRVKGRERERGGDLEVELEGISQF